MSSERLTRTELDRYLAALDDLVRVLERVKPDRSCFTCEHAAVVMNGSLKCGRWDAEIPNDAREAGCEEHADAPNEIPF